MGDRFFGAVAGVALLASFGAANAGEVKVLSDSQLDTVSAGFAQVEATVSNAATVTPGNFSLADDASGARKAAITGTFATFGTGFPSQAFLGAVVGPPASM
jgi:hypothetical protein